MIFEEATKEAFSYYPSELSPKSHKSIIATCEFCGEFRILPKYDYRTFCNSCSTILGKKKKGKKTWIFGKKTSKETKAKQSAAHKGEKSCNFGKRGAETNNWQDGISFKPYCIKFNKEYREYIRNLFGDECFLCSRSTKDNNKALCVHHVNYNKLCGCDGSECICVPLCMRCHVKTNGDRDYWQALVMEMLKPFEAWEN